MKYSAQDLDRVEAGLLNELMCETDEETSITSTAIVGCAENETRLQAPLSAQMHTPHTAISSGELSFQAYSPVRQVLVTPFYNYFIGTEK